MGIKLTWTSPKMLTLAIPKANSTTDEISIEMAPNSWGGSIMSQHSVHLDFIRIRIEIVNMSILAIP